MSGTEEVGFKVKADTAGAIASIKELQKQAAESLEGIEHSYESLKGVAEAALAFLAVEKVAEFLKDCAKEAAENETAMRGLQTAMQLTGSYSDEAATSFGELAEHLSKTTKYTNDQILSSTALAKAYGLSNEQTEKMVTAATELSAASGEDLDSAIKRLGKTLSGNAGLLGSQTGLFKDLTKEQLRNGEAFDEIIGRYGGQAAGQMDTFAGKVSLNEKAFGELRKAIGQAITENEAVRTYIDGMAKAFEELEGWVKKNRSSLDALVNGAMKALVVSISVSVNVIQALSKSLELVVNLTGLALSGVTAFAYFMGDTWGAIIGGAADALLGMFEDILRGAGQVPVLGDALKQMGINTESAADGIKSFRGTLKETRQEGAAFLSDLSDDSWVATQNIVKGFEKADEGFEVFGKALGEVSDHVFEAADNTDKAVKKMANTSAGFKRQAAEDANDQKKILEDLQRFKEKLAMDGSNEFQKIELERVAALQKIAEFQKAKVLTDEKEIARLKLEVQEQYQKKSDDINKKAYEKFIADYRKAVEDAAKDPIEFSVKKLDIKPLDVEQGDAENTGAVLGGISSVLNGGAGAEKLLSGAASSFANALVPGIGGVVGGIFDKLAQGPDAVKQFVTEFVNQVPVIMQAVGDSIPALVDALVDTLINKGGIIKINEAFIKAMYSPTEAMYKAIGKALGIEVGNAFNIGNIGKTLSGMLGKASSGISEAGEALGKVFSGLARTIGEAFSKAVNGIAGALGSALSNTFSAIGGALQKVLSLGSVNFAEKFSHFVFEIPASILEGARKFVNHIAGFWGGWGEIIALPFQLAVRLMQVTVSSLHKAFEFFSDLAGQIPEALTGVIDGFTTRLPNAIAAGAHRIVEALQEFFGSPFGKLILEPFHVIIRLMQDTVALLHKAFEFFGGLASQLPAALRGVFDAFTTRIPNAIAGAGQHIVDVVQGFFGGSTFGKFITAPFQYVLDSFKLITNAIKDVFTDPIKFFRVDLPAIIMFPINELKKIFGGLKLPEFTFPKFPTFDWPSIPAPEWLKNLTNIGGGGDGGGGVLGSIGKKFGFATGGVVPAGFPNDSYPASLTSGERVLSTDQTAAFERLIEMLSSPESPLGGGNGGGQALTVNLQVGEAQLARVMLNINRQGFRVA